MPSSSSSSHFQPPPPIRTSTASSDKSHSSATLATRGYSSDLPPNSPASRYSINSATSPAEESFFGAIASRMRNGRSRSRSRQAAQRKRSKSPMVLPPEHFPPASSAAQPMSPTYPSSTRPHQSRHVSSASQSSTTSKSSQATRSSLQGPTRRSTNSSDMWRGRHSNSWLFNDFSVTDHAKDLFHRGRNSQS